MEYRNYKTGETISREQYIANGIERGELLIEEKCGCVVIQDRVADAYIIYCPKHEAIPDLYEACKEALELSHNPEVEKILIRAIAKVEGGQ